jgi:hypothetical protein
MESLDQIHLHPKLEDPRLTFLGRESNLGLHSGRRAVSTLAKSYLVSTLIAIRINYILACDMNMNIHEQ